VVELQEEPVGMQGKGLELVEVVGSSTGVKEVVEFPVGVVEEGEGGGGGVERVNSEIRSRKFLF
jgi:hypothetical protein